MAAMMTNIHPGNSGGGGGGGSMYLPAPSNFLASMFTSPSMAHRKSYPLNPASAAAGFAPSLDPYAHAHTASAAAASAFFPHQLQHQQLQQQQQAHTVEVAAAQATAEHAHSLALRRKQLRSTRTAWRFSTRTQRATCEGLCTVLKQKRKPTPPPTTRKPPRTTTGSRC